MSGGASVRSVLSIAPVRSSIMSSLSRTRLSFGELAQPAQVARPHLPQHDLERAECLPIGLVVAVGPLAPLYDQAGVLQHPQVLGYSRPADVRDSRGDLTGGALHTPDQPQD